MASSVVDIVNAEHNDTANASRVLIVDATGAVPTGYTVVYDSGSRQLVGWGGSGAVDVRPYKHVQIIAVVSAFDNAGGATLSTSFPYNALAPDGTSTLVAGFSIGGKAYTATGAGATTWEPLSGSGGAQLIAGQWNSYGVSPPPYVSITVTNSGTTTSVTGRVWVFARS